MTAHPKPPSLRALARELRELHEAYAHPISGGEYAALYLACEHDDGRAWWAGTWEEYPADRARYGREWIPGDGLPFDAVAAARRLLAAWKDAQS